MFYVIYSVEISHKIVKRKQEENKEKRGKGLVGGIGKCPNGDSHTRKLNN